MNLWDFDAVIVNSSAGKDSLVALFAIHTMQIQQSYPANRVFVSHSDLGEAEWIGTHELAKKQAELFGYSFISDKRIDKDGKQETLLEYVLRRKKWPDNKNRYCTSDFKRVVGGKILTKIWRSLDAKQGKILNVFGFRAEESPARSKKKVLSPNKIFTTKSREVWDYLPIHKMTTQEVWDIIHQNNLPYHFAYDLGMPRLSCVFCVFSPFEALVIAGKHNRELLDKYIEVEKEIQHTFRHNFSLAQVAEAIDNGYEPKGVSNWIM